MQVERGGGILSPEIKAVVVCEKMGWDYHTFLDQPDWFIDLLLRKFGMDAKRQERLMRRHGNNRSGKISNTA